jgi:hypothetical protein
MAGPGVIGKPTEYTQSGNCSFLPYRTFHHGGKISPGLKVFSVSDPYPLPEFFNYEFVHIFCGLVRLPGSGSIGSIESVSNPDPDLKKLLSLCVQGQDHDPRMGEAAVGCVRRARLPGGSQVPHLLLGHQLDGEWTQKGSGAQFLHQQPYCGI